MSRLARFTVLVLVASWPAAGQGLPGSSPSNPFIETSAGRAWQRIAFGAIDCGPGLSEASAFCPNDKAEEKKEGEKPAEPKPADSLKETRKKTR